LCAPASLLFGVIEGGLFSLSNLFTQGRRVSETRGNIYAPPKENPVGMNSSITLSPCGKRYDARNVMMRETS
jgi:hypothetical protein